MTNFLKAFINAVRGKRTFEDLECDQEENMCPYKVEPEFKSEPDFYVTTDGTVISDEVMSDCTPKRNAHALMNDMDMDYEIVDSEIKALEEEETCPYLSDCICTIEGNFADCPLDFKDCDLYQGERGPTCMDYMRGHQPGCSPETATEIDIKKNKTHKAWQVPMTEDEKAEVEKTKRIKDFLEATENAQVNENYEMELKKTLFDDPEHKDMVDHPEHYTSGNMSGIENWDLQELDMSEEEFRGAMKFNIKKYTGRCGKKGDRVIDLKKARAYLNRWIEFEEGVRVHWTKS